MAGTTKTKKPPIKETVGAQYICFNVMSDDNDWTSTFETEIEKTEVVKKVTVTENADSSNVWSSGKVYDTVNQTSSAEISTEVIAFPADTLAKMRGETVGTDGIILSGGSSVRPFFAYGKVVKMKGGSARYDWYPKCKLKENTDEAQTKEDSFSEQTDTITIEALPFNDAGDVKVYADTSIEAAKSITEESFFSAVKLGSTEQGAN